MSEVSARPYIGGQAVIEGVMMRSPGSVSIVCRRRSGELVVHERPMAARPKGPRSWPFLRGMTSVVESLTLGMEALRWSISHYEEDLEAEEADEPKPRVEGVKRDVPAVPRGPSLLSALALGLVALATSNADDVPRGAAPDDQKSTGKTLLALIPAVALFVALPQLGAEGINKLFHLGLEVTSPGFQAITGIAKLTIVVGYMLLIRQVGDVRRTFQYHGAEHKTISTYEAGEALLVENARAKTTLHPRCGTTFLVMVAFVSIIVFSAVGAFLPHLPGGRIAQSVGFFLMKLPFLPVIAAITFEIQRVFARYCTTGPLRVLLWPGFLVQKITTIEPDESQLEVALASLRATLWREAALEAPAPADRVFAGYGELLADPGYVRE